MFQVNPTNDQNESYRKFFELKEQDRLYKACCRKYFKVVGALLLGLAVTILIIAYGN